MKDTGRHWLFVAYKPTGLLIYGCLVHGAEPWATVPDTLKARKLEVGGTEIHIVQDILDTSAAKHLHESLMENALLDYPLPYLSQPIAFSGMCRHLADRFGRNSRRIETLTTAQDLIMQDGSLKDILAEVEKETQISFRKTPYCLGSFEVFDIPENGEGESLLSLNIALSESEVVDGLSVPQAFALVPAEEVTFTLQARVLLSHAGVTMYNRFHTVQPGISLKVESGPWSGYELSVYNEEGELVQQEEHTLILRVGMNTRMQGKQFQIKDKLSERAAGLGGSYQTRASVIRTATTSRFLTGVPYNDFEEHSRSMRMLLQNIYPNQGYDRWFNQGLSEEIAVIAHLQKLLNSGNVKHAVVADPFFGEIALERMVTRIKTSELALSIVTSLAKMNPDTGRYDYDISHMRRALNNLRSGVMGEITRNLRLINLDAGQTQAFHDRYLMLEFYEGERQIYLLSNSFNRMAGIWPFCMSRLDEAVMVEVGLYLDGLLDGKDISGSVTPVVTMDWPNDETTH